VKRWLPALVVALLTMLVVVVKVGPAQAATCTITSSNFHNSMTRDQGTNKVFAGMRGTIETRDATVCTTSQSNLSLRWPQLG
jgi:hypothetical protein